MRITLLIFAGMAAALVALGWFAPAIVMGWVLWFTARVDAGTAELAMRIVVTTVLALVTRYALGRGIDCLNGCTAVSNPQRMTHLELMPPRRLIARLRSAEPLFAAIFLTLATGGLMATVTLTVRPIEWPGKPLLVSDWAGRAILEHYFIGNGETWVIENDAAWSQYMMRDNFLAHTVAAHMSRQIEKFLSDDDASKTGASRFSERFSTKIENGEDAIGYEYLHIPYPDAGDFEFNGVLTRIPHPDGSFRVNVQARYVWNDIIRANIGYRSDIKKSTLAYLLSYGRAAPYIIRIGWNADTAFDFNPNGTMAAAYGYPYQP
ncbi:Uncharacterised protein [Mycobacteroides abscessus subsp. bolletii]|uniref:hypothetical protein n=1 Tax=Mycobacteroides abscessus TaxID=36809 RepID=UPI0009CDA922|nr:hypothetical protein [Mycobacteroides abscessus]SKK44858.1 Uncharacterised protein [Mycobacteroides abscessus subsp. bolletii]